MAEPDLHAISSAIRECLAGPLRGGEFDFTAASGRGRHGLRPKVPWVEVSAPRIRSQQGPIMGQYTRTLVYDIIGWARVETGDLTDRTETSERLADAMIDALERERLTAGSALRDGIVVFEISGVALDAAADPVPDRAACTFLTLELAYRRRTGLGGTQAP